MSMAQLITIMERLLEAHQSLLELAEQKTSVIEKGDMAALNSIVKQEQKILPMTQKYEQARMQIVRSILSHVTDKEAEMSISTCLTQAAGEEKQRLAVLRDELLAVATTLQQRNELNSQLVNQSLRFIQMSLDMFYPKAPVINYGPSSGNGQTRVNSLFNRKA